MPSTTAGKGPALAERRTCLRLRPERPNHVWSYDFAGCGRNDPADFRGEKRSNETHASTTDPDAMLYRKGPGMEARLCFIGHGLMETTRA